MHNTRTKPGYIFILTLMVMALAVVVVSYIFNSGAIHVPFTKTMIDREKAKQLAFSGIQIAISQLSQTIDMPKADKKEGAAPPTQSPVPKESPDEQAAKELLKEILPALNRWQQFALQEEVDGIDGSMSVCLMSEEGKININALYDFKKHTFKGSPFQQEINKLLLREICKSVGKPELFDDIEKYLKARQYRLDDVTELLTIKGGEAFKEYIFYQPPAITEAKKNSTPSQQPKKNKKQVYLTDIFTVWSGKDTVDPWLLSDSLCALLGVKRAESSDIESRKEMVKNIVKEFKTTMQFPADWKKLFEPLYGVEFKDLPKGVEYILNTKFEPKIFSVLSYGNVGAVTMKLLAVLERTKQTAENQVSYGVTIKKIYWL